ncbi:MAG TPA: hypothetical protein GX699_08160 [Firmicutes bacterium]|nr:hypothetical protein [Bacillota bacterium]
MSLKQIVSGIRKLAAYNKSTDMQHEIAYRQEYPAKDSVVEWRSLLWGLRAYN